jgi:hypothetical protein
MVPAMVGLTAVSTSIVDPGRGIAAAILKALAADEATADAAIKARVEEWKPSIELLGSVPARSLLRSPAVKEPCPRITAEIKAAISPLHDDPSRDHGRDPPGLDGPDLNPALAFRFGGPLRPRDRPKQDPRLKARRRGGGRSGRRLPGG